MTEQSPDSTSGKHDDIEDAQIVPTPPLPAPAASAPPLPPDPLTGAPMPGFDYSDAGVPTLDFVRDRIEKRLGTAVGATELAEAAVPERVREEQERRQRQADDREQLARAKLDEIRRSLGR